MGTSIRLFLVDGTPEGLRIVDKSNWNGVAAVSSRAEYPKVRPREEFGRPGVYVLVGPSEGESILPRIYIGEADEPRKRLDSHVASKDFWTRVVVFGSKVGPASLSDPVKEGPLRFPRRASTARCERARIGVGLILPNPG